MRWRHSATKEVLVTQALILTHELSDEKTFDTYLVHELAPLRPLICFGRSANAPPRVGSQHAVRSWWEDPGGIRTPPHIPTGTRIFRVTCASWGYPHVLH